MSTLRALKKLVLGETWLLPIGVALLLLVADVVLRPLAAEHWETLGGFAILAGAGALLLISVAQGTRPK